MTAAPGVGGDHAEVRFEPSDGAFRVATERYGLEVDRLGRYATLDDAGGRWATLLLDASVGTRAGVDETVTRGVPIVETSAHRWRVSVELGSATWARKVVQLDGDPESVRFCVAVEGTGELTDVDLLAGWSSAEPWAGSGYHASGAAFRTVMAPGPSDPARLVRPAGEPAALDVSAGSGPGRGNWFFTPPPLCFALSRQELPRDQAPGSLPDGPWLTLGLECPLREATFGAVRYEPGERSFAIRLEYEGQTRVDGRFESPSLVLVPGVSDPYAGIRAWSDRLRGRGLAPSARPGTADVPGWWREPIVCGWGEQGVLARERGGHQADHATQSAYDALLDTLEAEGLVPGTIVIDDRWQCHYAVAEPEPERWPDLGGWIADRHAHGQRVLLWWKCWDPDGLSEELCIRNAAGVPVAVDPSNPDYEAHLRTQVRRMLGSAAATGDGSAFDADGLKVDFTGLTPSGPSLGRRGREWGVALLHRLLSILHDEAHRLKPDALVITHTPHPWFADVTDMLRLNDLLRLAEPDERSGVVEQMVHRARIVAAAMPTVPIDTDDWCSPDLATWRRFQAVKPDLGVPSLYYATGLDLTGEPFAASDYELLRSVWAEARRRAGLPQRGTAPARDPQSSAVAKAVARAKARTEANAA